MQGPGRPRRLLPRGGQFLSVTQQESSETADKSGSSRDGLDPYDPRSIFTETDEQDFESIRTRQRFNRAGRQDVPVRATKENKPSSELLDSLGLTCDEFNNLPESERQQLLEAVLQSREEYKLQEKRQEQEKRSPYQKPSLQCSVSLSSIRTEENASENRVPRPNLRLRRKLDVIEEVTRPDEGDRPNDCDPPKDDARLRTKSDGCIQGEFESKNSCSKNNQKPSTDIQATRTMFELMWDPLEMSPVKQLIRKYRVKSRDVHPLHRRDGVSSIERVRAICDYLTRLEHLRSAGLRHRMPSTLAWGAPIAIEVIGNKSSVRTRSRRQENSAETSDSATKDSRETAASHDSYTLSDIVSREPRRKLALNADVSYVESVPCTRPSVEAESGLNDVTLDSRWVQQDVESRLRNSRQTKIGGGLLDESPKILRKKAIKRRTDNDVDGGSDVDKDVSKKQPRMIKSRKQKGPKKNSNVGGNFLLRTGKNDSQQSPCLEQSKEASPAVKGAEMRVTREVAVSLERTDVEKAIRLSLTRKECDQAVEQMDTSLSSANDSDNKCESGKDLNVSSGCENEDVCRGNSLKSVESPSDVNSGQNGRLGCDVEVVSPSSSATSQRKEASSVAHRRCKEEKMPPDAFERLLRPSIRECDNRRNLDTAIIEESAEEGDNDDDDDNDEDYSVQNEQRKKRKRKRVDTAGAPGKKKGKPQANQQSIRSFTAPSQTLLTSTDCCPMCQKEIPSAEYESHVVDCVELDEKRTRRR